MAAPGSAQGQPGPTIAAVAARVAVEFDPANDDPTTLPFVAMREANDGVIEVKLAGEDAWLVWQGIDGVDTARIVAVCHQAFGSRWWKRLSEDLPQVVRLMGTELGSEVRLTLASVDGASLVRERVPMTVANRQTVKGVGYVRKSAAVAATPGSAQSQPGPAVAAVAARVAAEFDPANDDPTTLPFVAMREANEGVIEVKLAGEDAWLVWQGIDGVDTARIVAVCHQAFGSRWWKRLSEDLPQVVRLMGTALGSEVRLTLASVDGASLVRERVPMTVANRQTVKGVGYVRKSANEQSPGHEPSELAAQVRAAFDPGRDIATTSPFVWMQSTASGIIVKLNGEPKQYRWRALDGVPASTIAAVCRAAFGAQWWKRITEDLPQVLLHMGVAVGDTVTLELEDPDTGQAIRREHVPMTAYNRRAVREAVREQPPPVDPTDLGADAAALEVLLHSQASYAHLRGDALRAALAALHDLAEQPLTRARSALAVQECLAAVGDGHAGVSGWEQMVGGPWLPFLPEEAGGRVVAIEADRAGFVHPAHPFLVAIDGEPIESWLATAARLVNHGAPHAMRRRALRTLREVQALRLLRGEPVAATLAVTFEGSDGERLTAPVALSTRRPVYGTWPRPELSMHRELEGRIGYLRLDDMASDRAYLARLDTALAALRMTRGLIVDVRGNGGGTRDVLRRFLPYLLREDEPACVINAATYRRGAVPEAAAKRGEALADRGLYPAAWTGWSPVAKRVIENVQRSFRPAWTPPPEDFGEWHYAVVERTDNPDAFHYAAPIVVLIDGDCFSATDVFVGALRGRHNVTLLGRPTGGGSGRAQTHRLPSGLEVRLSTMVSFRPDGALYDGYGITPDVVVEPAAGDLVGRGDHVLEAAHARLR